MQVTVINMEPMTAVVDAYKCISWRSILRANSQQASRHCRPIERLTFRANYYGNKPLVLTRISDLELRLEHGTPSLLLKARTLPRKAGHDGIKGYSWPVLVVR